MVNGAELAWSIQVGHGTPYEVTISSAANASAGASVRCVRGGAPILTLERYTLDQAEKTVSDNWTGLIWRQEQAPGTFDWQAATSACRTLGARWRLPTVRELLTLVDPTKLTLAIDPVAFPSTPDEPFWTSVPDSGGRAWVVDFGRLVPIGAGVPQTRDTSSQSRVRCVR